MGKRKLGTSSTIKLDRNLETKIPKEFFKISKELTGKDLFPEKVSTVDEDDALDDMEDALEGKKNQIKGQRC